MSRPESGRDCLVRAMFPSLIGSGSDLQFKNNKFAEMSTSEEGLYVRIINFFITQL